jgi:protein-L-isoaspartate O-methyltransferase
MTLPTDPAALAQRYDAIAYTALPHPLTHPDRLATIASLMGMQPPPVTQCRVLEVGCSDGSNLIPLAEAMPTSRFVGCDLSPVALARGRATIAALGLTNVTLVEEDLAVLASGHGNFDYVIAHGVYSWVPAPVRDSLMALAAARLAPNGVMFVSFNALPGCRVRQATWEILHWHVDRIADPHQRLTAARALAALLGAGGKTLHEADEAMRAEFRAIAASSDSELFHDTLAVPNDPFYFHEFATHAGKFGLAYLAEAELQTMSPAGLSPELRELLSPLAPQDREQYLDFARLRRFRQALVRRADMPLDVSTRAERIGAMHVAATAALVRASGDGTIANIVRGLDPASGGHGPLGEMLDALVQGAPAASMVNALRQALGQRALARPLESLLIDAYLSGIVNLHMQPPALVRHAGERPVASALARWEARQQHDVTCRLHTRVSVPDTNARHLLTLLDGTRNRADLAAAMTPVAFVKEPAMASRFVAHALEQFGRMALLTA